MFFNGQNMRHVLKKKTKDDKDTKNSWSDQTALNN